MSILVKRLFIALSIPSVPIPLQLPPPPPPPPPHPGICWAFVIWSVPVVGNLEFVRKPLPEGGAFEEAVDSGRNVES